MVFKLNYFWYISHNDCYWIQSDIGLKYENKQFKCTFEKK